jgi:hypothetical protein
MNVEIFRALHRAALVIVDLDWSAARLRRLSRSP